MLRCDPRLRMKSSAWRVAAQAGAERFCAEERAGGTARSAMEDDSTHRRDNSFPTLSDLRSLGEPGSTILPAILGEATGMACVVKTQHGAVSSCAARRMRGLPSQGILWPAAVRD